MKILFLGAGKRYSLLDLFKNLTDKPELFSIERRVDEPIGKLAKIYTSVSDFSSIEFTNALLVAVGKIKPDIIIPCMDTAVVALANIQNGLEELGVKSLVPSLETAKLCLDKKEFYGWCTKNDFPCPEEKVVRLDDSYDKFYIKPRYGNGSKDHLIVDSPEAHKYWLSKHSFYSENDAKYVFQEV